MFAFVSTVTTVSNDPVSNDGSILVVIINFSTPLSPSCEEGSLTHSQALALSKRARDVTAPFNSLYDPFGSPCRGQKRRS